MNSRESFNINKGEKLSVSFGCAPWKKGLCEEMKFIVIFLDCESGDLSLIPSSATYLLEQLFELCISLYT